MCIRDRFKSDGRYYGQRLYSPNGLFNDESIVPLSPFSKLSGQFKLTYNLKPGIKIDYSGYATEKSYKNYDNYYKYNPDGLLWNYESDRSDMFSLTHSLSQKTFYELKYLDFNSGYNQSLYEIDDVPFKAEIFSENDLENIDLDDTIYQ